MCDPTCQQVLFGALCFTGIIAVIIGGIALIKYLRKLEKKIDG